MTQTTEDLARAEAVLVWSALHAAEVQLVHSLQTPHGLPDDLEAGVYHLLDSGIAFRKYLGLSGGSCACHG